MLGRNKGILCIAVICSLFLGRASAAEDFCQLNEAEAEYYTEKKWAYNEMRELERELKFAQKTGKIGLVEELEEKLATVRLQHEAAVRRAQEAASLKAALTQAPGWLSPTDKEKIICASGHQPDLDPFSPSSSRAPRKNTLAVLEEVMSKHPNAPAGFNVREFLTGVKRRSSKGRACQAFQVVASGILVVWDLFEAKADTPAGPQVSCPVPTDTDDQSEKPRGVPTGSADSSGAEPQTCKPIVCPAGVPTPSSSPSPVPTGIASR